MRLQWGLPLLAGILTCQTNLADGNPSLSLCAVLKDPSLYQQKDLVIAAGYRVGFEWQELLCFTCASNDRVWVEFDPDTKGISKIPKSRTFDQLYKVTFRGTFEGGSLYGHNSGYAFQFQVSEVKSAELVWRLATRHKEIPADVKACVCEASSTPRRMH